MDGQSNSFGNRAISSPAEKINLEIRKIEQSKLTKLSSIVDLGSSYKFLAEALAKPLPPPLDGVIQPAGLCLSVEVMNLIDQQVQCGKSPTMALLNHWGITGRRRPTIRDLLYFLRSSHLKRAEDYVQTEILELKPPIPPRQPYHPSAIEKPQQNIPALDYFDEQYYQIDDQFRFKDLHTVIESIGDSCKKYSFKSIYSSTNKFCHKPYNASDNSGTLMGEGRFSTVFRARTKQDKSLDDTIETVAAKLLKCESNLKYVSNEVNLMQRTKHPNILELLGISLGRLDSDVTDHYVCFIYPFMQNGSLYDCLRSGVPTNNGQHLTWYDRIDILVKVARGITYLHTFAEKPVIHRDVKTANVLLDTELEPRLGDFTLVRQLDVTPTRETQQTMNIIGTNVYMPPEGLRGNISVKFDTFSYGIVIFELLSGMRLYDEEREEDLYTYLSNEMAEIEELAHEPKAVKSELEMRRDFLRGMLDSRAGDWRFDLAFEMFAIALQAIESNKTDRPKMVDLMNAIEDLNSRMQESQRYSEER